MSGNDAIFKPPLLIKSTLELAWGLTLFLSTSDKQSHLADQIYSYLLPLFQTSNFSVNPNPQTPNVTLPPSVTPVTPSPPYSPTSGDPTKLYLQNLIAAISTYLRRMGFEKDIYDRFLNTQKDLLQKETDYWQSMGTMTSFSGDSTLVKIAAFFGFGASGGTIREMLGSMGKNPVANPLSNTNQTNTTGLGHNAIHLPQNATPSVSGLPSETIFAIIIAGTIGLFAVMVFLKWLGKKRVTEATKKTLSKQDEYWKQVMQVRFHKQLELLYHDIVDLIKRYYTNYNDDPLINPPDLDKNGHSRSVERVINEILPTRKDMYRTWRHFL